MAVNTIGRSADGRDIYQIIVGSPKASRRLLIQSAIHGREYLSLIHI